MVATSMVCGAYELSWGSFIGFQVFTASVFIQKDISTLGQTVVVLEGYVSCKSCRFSVILVLGNLRRDGVVRRWV